jgi:hypothetical protein
MFCVSLGCDVDQGSFMHNAYQDLEQAERLVSLLSDAAVKTVLSEHNVEPASLLRYAEMRAAYALQAPQSGYFPDVDAPATPAPPEDSPLRMRPPRRNVERALNVTAFSQALHAILSAAPISGYAMRIFQRDTPVYTLFWNWARRPQDPLELGWSPSVKMHIASVSKLITAMAVVRLLRERGINVDTPISPYLPDYFVRGANTQQITFRHLLTHTSGFRKIESGGYSDGNTFADFRFYFGLGVNASDMNVWHYHNANYIALRIAIAVLLGSPARDFKIDSTWPGWIGRAPELNVLFTDASWDSQSIDAYAAEVSNRIFSPAGVSAHLFPDGSDSLAYPINLASRGKDLNAYMSAGAAGWWLSCDELLKIMHVFRHTNMIVPAATARAALNSGFGVDGFQPWQQPRFGRVDCLTKAGFWSDGGGATQQSFVAFCPDGHNIAILVNSPIPGNTIDSLARSLLRLSLS